MSIKILLTDEERKALEKMQDDGQKGNTTPRVVPVASKPKPKGK